MKQQLIKLTKIVENKGQIEGLPRNPRQIKDEKYKLLKKSIEEDPEMLELRELLVYPHNNKFVVIGGNMRLKVLRELGVAECPCKVIPAETPIEKLRAYTIKDNNSFGEYDFDLLGNNWEVDELLDWGCDLPDIDTSVSIDDIETSDNFSLKSGDKDPFQQMAFVLADAQAEILKQALEDVKHSEEFKYIETFGNNNANGNALYLIISQWADAKK